MVLEGEVRALDAAAGEVTLVVDPLHQRRLRSSLMNVPEVGGPTPSKLDDDDDDDGFSLAQAADVVLAGRTLRLVRVPDVVTYERQLAALNTLRNVPRSRTKPPAVDIVRALFASSRCPPSFLPTNENEGKEEEEEEIAAMEDMEGEDEASNFTRVVGFFADAPDVALSDVASASEGSKGQGNKKLLNVREVTADDLPPLDFTTAANGGPGPLPPGFDKDQSLAVRAALTTSAPVTWVQGPPGTGKTGVVIEIIRRAVASGMRVLACAPSNAAVDNLVERLAALNQQGETIDFVRIGAPERISSAALASSLDARVIREAEDFFDSERTLRRREIIDATRKGRETQERLQRERRLNPNDLGGVMSEEEEDVAAFLSNLRREQRNLTKSGKKVKAAAERSVLSSADVVLATSVGAGAQNIQKLPGFDLAVLDEVRTLVLLSLSCFFSILYRYRYNGSLLPCLVSSYPLIHRLRKPRSHRRGFLWFAVSGSCWWVTRASWHL